MKRYLLTPEAQGDLEHIVEYIRVEAGASRAARVLSEIRGAFRKLAGMPGMGHFREDLLDEHYKFWTVYSYVIVYRWEVRPIQIIAVIHGARDLAALFAHRKRRLR
ncbi:MAG TPA: type II toxin-antitoxin system RelE/ParE family toxin [Tepidisphaeraceae bacterium]|jgi:antitoxin ParD1/3/4/toxin ParE1/3/4